ncbi:hypothetical protein [Lentzea sp. HUAS12]|uniref:hypothetical protein n=1 Tax=Lentzea sp. HUAS12 TaxID=2951806 RepID=UPI0020A1B719|nr:hypothetical protein [Lentzea sp. HUAS12]USX52452.1 hypothetical protein ND450_45305 [Lentzea sp. HUAS12]
MMAGVTVLSTTPATAQQPPSLSAAPQPATAGGPVTMTWGGFVTCRGVSIVFTLDGTQIATAPSASSGSVGATVPSGTSAGSHKLEARSTNTKCGTAGTALRVVLPPPVTTTRPPVTTQPPVTNPPVTNPPVTTRPPVVTTTTTPVTTTTTTTTTTTPPSSSTTNALTNPGDGVLVLDKDNIQPGDDLTATGTGCPKGANVTLKSLGQDVGRTTADENGTFSSPVRFSNIEPGRHKVLAECGIVLAGNVDVTLSSSSGGTTSTLVVLLFFLLVGAAMLRRQFSGLRR